MQKELGETNTCFCICQAPIYLLQSRSSARTFAHRSLSNFRRTPQPSSFLVEKLTYDHSPSPAVLYDHHRVIRMKPQLCCVNFCLPSLSPFMLSILPFTNIYWVLSMCQALLMRVIVILWWEILHVWLFLADPCLILLGSLFCGWFCATILGPCWQPHCLLPAFLGFGI